MYKADKDRVKQLLFSSRKTVLTVYSVQEDKTVNKYVYRITKGTNTFPVMYFVWGREYTESNMKYIAGIRPDRSSLVDSDISLSKDDMLYRMFKYFMLTIFNEYPWMDEMGIDMTTLCNSCENTHKFFREARALG